MKKENQEKSVNKSSVPNPPVPNRARTEMKNTDKNTAKSKKNDEKTQG